MVQTKEGYRQTEIGVLPKDWEVSNLGELTDKIVGGGTPSRANKKFWGNEIPWVTVKDFTSYNPYFSEEYITYEGLRNSSSNLIPKNTLITPTRIGLGKAKIYLVDVAINQDLKALFLNKLVFQKYLYYWFEKNEEFIIGRGNGSTVLGISLDELRSFQIPLPPLSEQEKIAEALSDCDAWIESTEQLLAKKKLLKQGAMQQLLLPKDDWEVKKLGEIAEIYTGKKNNQDKVENGKYPFFVRSENVERINSYSFDGEAILIPGEGGIGSIFHYINGKFDFHQRVYKISDFQKGFYAKFIYWYLKFNFGKHALQNTVKATVDSLRLPTFEVFEIYYPSLSEQRRISGILSDMDSEIASLEATLHKARHIKQGMMQDLLTGRVRLV